MHYIAKRDHYAQILRYSDRINSKFIKDMKSEMGWIKHNEDALVHLISQSLLARSVGSLPIEGGLFNQNYWFVLVLSELNLYIKKLESERITQ